MTKPWTCTQVEEVSAELALGLLSGNDRGAALDHLESCARCSAVAAADATVIDRLLLAGPRIEPPAGFEARVLEAIDLARPEAPQRPRRRAMLVGLAAAAAIIVILSTLGIGLLAHSGHPSHTRVADMIGTDGTRVGKVELGRSPATVLIALPGWEEPTGEETTYRMTVVTRDGSDVDIGPLRLDESGTWSGGLSVDPSTVASVTVADAAGRPLCHATLTRS